MAEALGVGVHPGGQAGTAVGIEANIVVRLGGIKQREESAVLRDSAAGDGVASTVTLPDLVNQAGLAVVDEGIIGPGGGKVEPGGDCIFAVRGVA